MPFKTPLSRIQPRRPTESARSKGLLLRGGVLGMLVNGVNGYQKVEGRFPGFDYHRCRVRFHYLKCFVRPVEADNHERGPARVDHLVQDAPFLFTAILLHTACRPWLLTVQTPAEQPLPKPQPIHSRTAVPRRSSLADVSVASDLQGVLFIGSHRGLSVS